MIVLRLLAIPEGGYISLVGTFSIGKSIRRFISFKVSSLNLVGLEYTLCFALIMYLHDRVMKLAR